MAANTAIEWTDHTFNPWEGCQKVGPGCDFCYAEHRQKRYNKGEAPNWGPGAPRRRTAEANWRKPLKWNREAEADGRRRRVFCASLADVFDNAVPWQWRLDLFDLISKTPMLDWQLLTKRIGNVKGMLDEIQVHGDLRDVFPNVWLGATIVNQEEADRDIPKLLPINASIRFLSMEPLLGPVDLCDIRYDDVVSINALNGRAGVPFPNARATRGIDWVITGGESGPNARPIHSGWVEHIRDACAQHGTAFLHKQWGEWLPSDQWNVHGVNLSKAPKHVWDDGTGLVSYRIGKKWAGRKLARIEHSTFPRVPA